MIPKAPKTALVLALLGFLGCTSSYAETVSAEPRTSYPTSVAPQSSPYGVELLDASGNQLASYAQDGRAYVLGNLGERYRVRVRNPTSSRVEAVVSVDGLDVVDGKTATTGKRGYLIEAFGEVTIEGFRTSLRDVATFRFASVRDSYAGRKGQARNVGVIGVALFAEKPRPMLRYPAVSQRAPNRTRGETSEPMPSPPTAAAPASPSEGGYGLGAEAKGAGRATAAQDSSSEAEPSRKAQSSRRGLGTEFGEQRSSHVEYTSFERQNDTRPTSVVELRYNDREGLLALGIPVDGVQPTSELELRETASPFPAQRFSQPPP